MTALRTRRAPRHPNAVRALTPAQARPAWIALCEAVIAATAAPETVPMSLIDPLRAVPKGSFPLPAGDVRADWAEAFRAEAERWRTTQSYQVRRLFSGALGLRAREIIDLVRELGAAEASNARARMGLRDD